MGVSNKPETASVRNRQRRLTDTAWTALSEAYLAADALSAARDAADRAARRALDAGASLRDVGEALRISKQAAHARYAVATARRMPQRSGDTLF